jgi:glycopeptide antibiotics resistance protein
MLRKIARDKWKHFFVGIGMGIFLQAFFLYALDISMTFAFIWSLVLSIVISFGFEFYSLITGHGHYEVMDAVAGIAGALVGLGIFFVIYGFIG